MTPTPTPATPDPTKSHRANKYLICKTQMGRFSEFASFNGTPSARSVPKTLAKSRKP